MIMAKKINKRSPKKELNLWLRLDRLWDHSDWTDLLQNLLNQGFHELCASIDRQNDFGFYLETKRHSNHMQIIALQAKLPQLQRSLSPRKHSVPWRA